VSESANNDESMYSLRRKQRRNRTTFTLQQVIIRTFLNDLKVGFDPILFSIDLA